MTTHQIRPGRLLSPSPPLSCLSACGALRHSSTRSSSSPTWGPNVARLGYQKCPKQTVPRTRDSGAAIATLYSASCPIPICLRDRVAMISVWNSTRLIIPTSKRPDKGHRAVHLSIKRC
ncbi:hypothetical protein LY78DRAFT_393686 [Colletotrichum sublineola]|nr:hypothetical protein LY78DRAFT_393686 [Colletotrichum sublineola]